MTTLQNIILDDTSREVYKDVIAEMKTALPEMMSRKINRANVQQAWMLNTIRKVAQIEDVLLSVGSYEDTAYEMLRKDGYSVIGIDPVLNYDVGEYAKLSKEKFDVVFSTSVIEHVADDEQFITDMASLLKHNGYGFFTCDFNNDYPRACKPLVDERLYTINDLTIRIPNLLLRVGCEIVGSVDYSGTIDFEYEGCMYAFATVCFKKTSHNERLVDGKTETQSA
jgi:SAM-dependent methyltransferase